LGLGFVRSRARDSVEVCPSGLCFRARGALACRMYRRTVDGGHALFAREQL